MPRKKQSKRMMRGDGWLSDIWDGVKSVAGVALPILKQSGIAGNLASSYNPALGAAVKAIGYGKKKPKRSVIGAGKKVIKA